MTDKTKITLSAKELELVTSTDWILTKHRILVKVYELFGGAASFLQSMIADNSQLPVEVWNKNAKISKGENYQQLPYVILDYPRFFSRDNVFALRTFFWWGNFISLNLQLSGTYKEQVVPNLKANFLFLQQRHYWICINDDPWQHHFEPDNFIPMISLSYSAFAAILDVKNFIKIGTKLPLEQFEVAPQFLEQRFREIFLFLKTSYQGGEKDLLPGIPKVGFDL